MPREQPQKKQKDPKKMGGGCFSLSLLRFELNEKDWRFKQQLYYRVRLDSQLELEQKA